jgi:hypothetical protein
MYMLLLLLWTRWLELIAVQINAMHMRSVGNVGFLHDG